MSDLLPTKDAQELLVQSRAMKVLIESPEYRILAEITRKQVEVWTILAMERTQGGDLYRSEWQKGVAYGIKLNLDTPSRIITEAQAILSRMETANGKRRSDPEPGSINSQLNLFGLGNERGTVRDTPESIAEQLGEPVGPDARVTADSN
jgi:hypothetical protein